jgi:tetratricopeptide (TPR) repeat protein
VTGTDELLTRIDRITTLSDAGDHEAALRLADEVIAVDPDHAAAYTARAWALENLCPEHLAEARDAYAEAIGVDPTELWAKEGLSTVLRKLGRAEEADALCREVIEEAEPRAEGDAEMLELLGWCRYRVGLYEDATATFRRSLSIDPDQPAVRFDLALTLLHTGDGRAGLAEYVACLALTGSGRRGSVDGLVAVALEDLETAISERPDLLELPEVTTARDLLRRR